jgi:ATP-dependent Zn protease
MSKSRIKKTAYHEAGHAVAHCFLHLPFKYVTIEQGEDSLGNVTPFTHPKSFRPDLYDDWKTRKRIEHQIMTCFAGHAAELAFSGRKSWKGASSDNHEAVNLASYLCGSVKQTEVYLNWMWERTFDWVKQPLHWRVIRVVAENLLTKKNLKAHEVRRIIYNLA